MSNALSSHDRSRHLSALPEHLRSTLRGLSQLRTIVNRHIPLDAVIRWWYILAAGVAVSLAFSLVTDINPLQPDYLTIYIVEGPPSHLQLARLLVPQPSWKENILFAMLGFLVASGFTWVLEEIRAYTQLIQQR